MVDLSDSPESTPAPADRPARPAGSRGQRLWAVLLVLDAFFVIVFGGALAAKIYSHLQAPVVPVAPQRRPRPAHAPEPAKPPEAAKPPAPAPAKPAQAPAKADQMKPPKPSLLNEAPRHEAAKPRGGAKTEAAPAPAPAASADGKPKAVSVEFKLTVPGAKRVELAGPFIVRGGGRMPMKDRGDGLWTLTLYLTPNTYRYHFLVDGKKTLDPQNPKTDRGASVVSVH